VEFLVAICASILSSQSWPRSLGIDGSAFNVPTAPLIPFVGKIYAICSTKLTFLLALFIFEVGSLLSAVAPTSIAFIVGRALSGAGSAGIFNGALVTITMISPLDKRPAYQSVIGGIYAIATIIAPWSVVPLLTLYPGADELTFWVKNRNWRIACAFTSTFPLDR